MFQLALKKMWKNKLITAAMFLGCLLVSLISAIIPILSDALLAHLYQQHAQTHITENSRLPLAFSLSTKMLNAGLHDTVEAVSRDILEPDLAFLPLLSKVTVRRSQAFFVHETNTLPRGQRTQREYFSTLEDLEMHTSIVIGRFPSKDLVDGVAEVVVSPLMYNMFKLDLDQTLYVYIAKEDPFPIKIVGVVEPADYESTIWQSEYTLDIFHRSSSNWGSPLVMLLQEETFAALLDISPVERAFTSVTFAYDHQNLSAADFQAFSDVMDEARDAAGGNITLHTPFQARLLRAQERIAQIEVLLWTTTLPLFFGLALYLVLVCTLSAEHDRNEIAFLKSRGSRTSQILWLYVCQSFVLCLAASLIAPFLGVLLVYLLGSVNGFMSFEWPSALRPVLTATAWPNVAIAALASILVTIVPALGFARQSIVELKRRQSRASSMQTAWKWLLVGLGLTGLSLYLIHTQAGLSPAATDDTTLLNTQPFFIFALLAPGGGMVLCALFPYIVFIVRKLFNRLLPPSPYMVLTNLARGSSGNAFIMVFLSLCVAIGLFSATTARSLRQNQVDAVAYRMQADFAVYPVWYDSSGTFRTALSEALSNGEARDITIMQSYRIFRSQVAAFAQGNRVADINLDPLYTLQSADAAQMMQSYGEAAVGRSKTNVEIFGVEPSSYAKVVWQRSNLFPYHISQYLYLLTIDPTACIITKEVQQNLMVNIGDTIKLSDWRPGIKLPSQDTPLIIAAVVDHWPLLDRNDNQEHPGTIITNLHYLQQQEMAVSPTLTLLSIREGYTADDVQAELDAIAESKLLNFVQIDRADMAIERFLRRSPDILTLDLQLTLCFILTLLTALSAYLIYWIFQFKERTLQIGSMRALGLTRRNIFLQLAGEQLVLSVFSALGGALIGTTASALLVEKAMPLALFENAALPFFVAFKRMDYLSIYALILGGVVCCIGLLLLLLTRLNIARALKLGED